jgi:hypothetical protein
MVCTSAHTNEFQYAPKRGRPSIVSKALQIDTLLKHRRRQLNPKMLKNNC